MTGRIGNMCCPGLGRKRKMHEALTGNTYKRESFEEGLRSWMGEEWFDPTEDGQQSCHYGNPKRM
jgi:hypothetical protein